jgi:hypothetical protein
MRVLNAVKNILDATHRVISPARAAVDTSPLAWHVQFIAKLAPVTAELCGKFRNLWPGEFTWDEEDNDQGSGALPGKAGHTVRRVLRITPEERQRADRMRAGERVAMALEKAAEAVNARSEESAEKMFLVVQKLSEVCSAEPGGTTQLS